MHVLIVDDADMSRKFIMAMLPSGCSYIEAKDGLEALTVFKAAQCSSAPFNLVLMDIIMPEMDGKTALIKMREFEQQQGLTRTPIYMVSASEMIDEVADKTDGLLRKPAGRQQLADIIASISNQ